MKTFIIPAIAFGVVILILAAVVSKNPSEKSVVTQAKNNVRMEKGKQVVEIRAKGGYSPSITSAKANIDTILLVSTEGTFDCSASLTIPSLGYRTILPPTGETKIKVPAQKKGSTLQALCSMGMYNFQVQFN
ncbi:MAG: cupredoxin domain-containing protein [Candidatus Roizmanbacteria bacterium]|nr:cupredoxin domain-containing protein [Candidatus Roizmanbacteria bacterium]